MIRFLDFNWCFGGDLSQWVAVAALGEAGFVLVVLWWCCGGTGWGWVCVLMVFCCDVVVAALGLL